MAFDGKYTEKKKKKKYIKKIQPARKIITRSSATRVAHSGQTQKSNATSGFLRLELPEFEEKTWKTSVGKCYRNSTVRENYKLGGL